MHLTAVQQDQCTIVIQWNPPYLLPGLSVSYKIYINGEMQDDISATNYIFYISNITDAIYNIKVISYNDSISGESSTITVKYKTGTKIITL